MGRRFLGPVGGPIAFFLVGALVFVGLGWVTYTALGVEQAQREAAARAELGYNLRVAVRQLDGRVLPALGFENSRPFYHYAPADPAGGYGPAVVPLLAANLPDWMTVHFQLDPVVGWESPQVLPESVADQLRLACPQVPLRNLNGSRADFLNNDLKARFPPAATCEVFAARDRAIPDDSLPLAAPLFTGEVNIPWQVGGAVNPTPQAPAEPVNPPAGEPTQNAVTVVPDPGEPLRLFGWDLGCRGEPQLALNNTLRQDKYNVQNLQPAAGETKQAPGPRAVPPVNPGNTSMARGGGARGDNERGWNEYMGRAQTGGKAIKDVPQAFDFPLVKNPYSQNLNYLDNNFRFYGNSPANPPLNWAAPGPPLAGFAVLPGVMLFHFADPVGKADKDTLDKLKDAKDRTANLRESDPAGGFLGGSLTALRAELYEQSALKKRAALEALRQAEEARGLGWFRELDGTLRRYRASDAPVGPAADPKATQNVTGTAGPTPPAVVPPAVPLAPDRPPSPIAVHLGSLRPQWVTAPDGAELLVLVRAAKYDNTTVYQGVVLDWPKLEFALKEEVKDLFPGAKLVPVKDPAGVSPDRAMTALPVQLDPGPDPTPPPAGWTTLRVGLVLAWAAAVIAFAAVGFSGWSLIDLAERRIRFVSAVTHELRTPLTSLRLYLDLLVSGMIQDEDKRREYLNTLAVESDRLHRLIDNVLDFARLEKRRKNGDVKPVAVAGLLDQLRQTWSDRLAQDGRELAVISTLADGRQVTTDPAMIQQIVGNLIDNARKYSRDAADKRIWVWAKPGRGDGVVVEVEDRGPGVPAAERRTVFKPFRRGEHADGTSGGAGLGLALAKSWAEVLGGKLTYRPADGGTGACFRLELPGK